MDLPIISYFDFCFLYSVGYAFEAQVLGTAIQQTFLYNLRLDFQHAAVLMVWQLSFFSSYCLDLKKCYHTLFSFRQEKYLH